MIIDTVVRGMDVSKLRGQQLIDFVNEHQIPLDLEDSNYGKIYPLIQKELIEAQAGADPVSGYGCGTMYSLAEDLTRILPGTEGEKERRILEKYFQ